MARKNEPPPLCYPVPQDPGTVIPLRHPGAPGLVMGPCIVEIDRIAIREVQYQLEVNRLKGSFGWVWPMWAGCPRIDRIVIRIVQYQLEVNRINFGLVWPIWAGHPRVEVQYQLEVDRCRNEEVIVKGIFGWVWPLWVGCLRVGTGAMYIEIDRIVIREFQYKFEVNQCRKEEIIVKGNFGWVWSMWAGRPRMDCIVIREVQYQFEVNRCRNEEVNFQGSSAYNDGQTDGRTDGPTAEITTISPRFSKSMGITIHIHLTLI
ncbi:hypothetical protein DPMN_020588 [Dreissena polymorpha]|uniref:Uncharacterized protein n=1 Tax=Dreissena polymorpha TaxID=45954 RepID=A0A9D4NLE4_DREPO|nr:hypothetical protein DPMN_020588 [Dreissena polymorpha]